LIRRHSHDFGPPDAPSRILTTLFNVDQSQKKLLDRLLMSGDHVLIYLFGTTPARRTPRYSDTLQA
jgi:hypothetical protein